MQEIIIIAKQQTGAITWNYTEMKNELKSMLIEYKDKEYTESNLEEAKADVAMLRKLKKNIAEKKSEMRNKALESYVPVGKEADELIGLVDEPINVIAGSITAYEDKRKEEKKKEIENYFNSILPESLLTWKDNIFTFAYDEKWENKKSTMKIYKEAYNALINQSIAALEQIKTLQSTFEDELISEYFQSFSMVKVITKNNDFIEKEKRIIEKAQEEARKKAEKEQEEKEREEKRKAEQERIQNMQATVKTAITVPMPTQKENVKTEEINVEDYFTLPEELPIVPENEMKVLYRGNEIVVTSTKYSINFILTEDDGFQYGMTKTLDEFMRIIMKGDF